MPRITLYNSEVDETYILDVSKEDAKRAKEDMQFATYLLNKYINSQTNSISDSSQDFISADTACQDVENICPNAVQIDDSQEKDNFRWPHEAILLLFKIYTDNEHQLANGKTTHKKFWELLSSQLNANGYDVTGIQCKSKMAGLKNTYKNVKDHNAKSGNCRRTWRYFDIMDEIFTKKPWAQPVLTLQSDNSTVTSNEEIEHIEMERNKKRSSDSLPDKTKLPYKRRRYDTLEKIIEENAAARQRMHEEAMSRQDKLLDILKKFLQQEK